MSTDKMLDWEQKKHLENITTACDEVWKKQYQINNIVVYPHPQGQFKIELMIYDKFDILLKWECGMVGIWIPKEFGIEHDESKGFEKMLYKDYRILNYITDKVPITGFDSVKPEILRHDFSVLDEILREMM